MPKGEWRFCAIDSTHLAALTPLGTTRTERYRVGPMNSLCRTTLAILTAAVSLATAQEQKPAAKASSENVAIVPAPRSEAGIQSRQDECVRRAKETKSAPVVFVGDSITQAWEGGGKESWQKEFAPMGALNLGVSGDRTEHVLWRLQQAPITHLEPKAIVLLIGTNNLGHGTSNAEQTLAGVQKVIATLREQAPKATLIVCEIFPRGERINAMRGDIAQVNQVLRGMADERTKVLGFSDQWVRTDGTISRDIMPDFLHLSKTGYGQWAAALKPALEAALK